MKIIARTTNEALDTILRLYPTKKIKAISVKGHHSLKNNNVYTVLIQHEKPATKTKSV